MDISLEVLKETLCAIFDVIRKADSAVSLKFVEPDKKAAAWDALAVGHIKTSNASDMIVVEKNGKNGKFVVYVAHGAKGPQDCHHVIHIDSGSEARPHEWLVDVYKAQIAPIRPNDLKKITGAITPEERLQAVGLLFLSVLQNSLVAPGESFRKIVPDIVSAFSLPARRQAIQEPSTPHARLASGHGPDCR